ncbi:MAG: hypothetical protein KJ011_00455 [Burkholderiaceae bacterium]|nr:hypothetical protein [Burkholderiaceae bacterium]
MFDSSFDDRMCADAAVLRTVHGPDDVAAGLVPEVLIRKEDQDPDAFGDHALRARRIGLGPWHA